MAREADIKEEFPFDVWRKASDLGLIGSFISEEYNGVGLGITEHCCITEEFWRVDPGCGQCMISAVIGAEVIEMNGTGEQKEKYLAPLPTGEKIMGIAITEPDAGSDTLSGRTSAVKDGDDYVISGTKTFITNGGIANFLEIYEGSKEIEKQIVARHLVKKQF